MNHIPSERPDRGEGAGARPEGWRVVGRQGRRVLLQRRIAVGSRGHYLVQVIEVWDHQLPRFLRG